MIRIKIYLDDNLDNDYLKNILRNFGFEVISPREIKMRHKKDEEHLKYAIINQALVLTKDKGFKKLHNKINHRGIIIIRQENNLKKDMKENKIVKALKNIEALKLKLENNLIYLNQFDY